MQKKIAPSRQLVLFVVGIAVLVGIFFLAKHYKDGNISFTQNRGDNTPIDIETLGEASDKDTDNDGLLDWEETLLGYDPENPDTDGDSVNDGDEVAAERSFFQEQLETSDITFPPTQTGLFARDLYTTIALLRQKGELNSASIENLSSLASGYIVAGFDQTEYTIADITTSDNDATNVLLYASGYATVIENYTPAAIGDPSTAFITAVTDDNEESLTALAPIITEHAEALQGFLALTVPADAVSLHLEIVNSISDVITDLEGMEQYFTDPILAFSGGLRYEIDMEEIAQALVAINSRYFTKFMN